MADKRSLKYWNVNIFISSVFRFEIPTTINCIHMRRIYFGYRNDNWLQYEIENDPAVERQRQSDENIFGNTCE